MTRLWNQAFATVIARQPSNSVSNSLTSTRKGPMHRLLPCLLMLLLTLALTVFSPGQVDAASSCTWATPSTVGRWTALACGCSESLGHWRPRSKDRMVVGDFNGDGVDALFVASALTDRQLDVVFDSGKALVRNRACRHDGQVAQWPLGLGDRYVAGDFDDDGAAEMMAISWSRTEHQLMEWTALGSQGFPEWLFRSGASGPIHLWNHNSEDQFVAGDFDHDGEDELLALSHQTGYKQLIEYDELVDQWQWRNGVGGGFIGSWPIQSGDRYVAGDFDGDGEDELAALSISRGAEQLLEYEETQSPNVWVTRSGSTNGAIDLWNFGALDKFVAGDFDGDGADELLAVSSQSGFKQVIDYDWVNNVWDWQSGVGGGQIGPWPIGPYDLLFAGDFDGDTPEADELIIASTDSCFWVVLDYN